MINKQNETNKNEIDHDIPVEGVGSAGCTDVCTVHDGSREQRQRANGYAGHYACKPERKKYLPLRNLKHDRPARSRRPASARRLSSTSVYFRKKGPSH
jgi:hypothetical protein